MTWNAVLPLVSALTKQNIGQIWVNHTGHDPSRSYGSKTKEWRMDTTIHLTAEQRADTDVSFRLEFREARERMPATRRDFEDVTIALVNDQWTGSNTIRQVKPKEGSVDAKFLEVLEEMLASQSTVTTLQGRRMIQTEVWREACIRCGLLDANAKTSTSRVAFHRHKSRLIAANLIICEIHEKTELVGLLP